MVQLVCLFTCSHGTYLNDFTYSRATRLLASEGFYVCLFHRCNANLRRSLLQYRHSGIGLTPQHGIPSDVSLEALSTQVSWPLVALSTTFSTPCIFR